MNLSVTTAAAEAVRDGSTTHTTRSRTMDNPIHHPHDLMTLAAPCACHLLGVTAVELDELATEGIVEELTPGRYSITSLRRYSILRAKALRELDEILATAQAARLDQQLIADLEDGAR